MTPPTLAHYDPDEDAVLRDVVIVGQSVYTALEPPALHFGKPWSGGRLAWFMPGEGEPLTTADLKNVTGGRGQHIAVVVRHGEPVYVRPKR